LNRFWIPALSTADAGGRAGQNENEDRIPAKKAGLMNKKPVCNFDFNFFQFGPRKARPAAGE